MLSPSSRTWDSLESSSKPSSWGASLGFPGVRKTRCVGGGFLQCGNFDVVVVESQVSPVALEKRVAELSVEESVVPEPGESNLQRRKVQCSIQDPECLLLVEQAHGQEVADLQDEATQFLMENRLPLADLAVEENDLLPCGEGGPQLSQRSKRVVWEFEQTTAHSALVAESLEQNDVVNGKREALVGFA